MNKLLLAFALLLAPSLATAQVKQSGSITPGHVTSWTTNGVIQDGGTAAQGKLTTLGVTATGQGICQNSGPVTGPFNQICLGTTVNGGGTLSLYNYNGATGGLALVLNGVTQGLPTIPVPTVANTFVCFLNNAGQLGGCSIPIYASVIAGGQDVASTLTLESTSGAGTSDAIIFKTGSQVERLRIETAGGLVQTYTGTAVGTAVDGSANEFAYHLDDVSAVTNSLASYEKIGLHVDVYTNDPSDYGSNILRDTVGADLRGTILTGNMLGRAFGTFTGGNIQVGADGYLVGAEIALSNDGTDQASVDTSTSKIGLHLTSGGLNDITAAIKISNNGTKFHHGLYADADVITDYFLNYSTFFTVNSVGRLEAANAVFNTGTGTPTRIANDAGYNLVSLNGNAFPSAIGVAGIGGGDNQLYLYAQSNHRFYSGNTPVGTITNDGGYELISLNDAVTFATAVGMESRAADPTLYFTSQSTTQFWVANAEVARFGSAGQLSILEGTAPPAGGSTTARLVIGSTAGFGVYIGSGAPSVSAAQGSLYLRTDGTTTNDRAYIAKDGAGTWTPLTTGS